MENEVLVIGINKLFDITDGYFQGFKKTFGDSVLRQIEENSQWMERDEAEKNPDFKQIIGYTAVIHPFIKKAFGYQRSIVDKVYDEKRLQGKYSWGISGHIKKYDDFNSLIQSGLIRELYEELAFEDGFSEPQLIGMINDDSDDVGKVHFGMLFYCVSRSPNVTPRSAEIKSGQFENMVDLKKFCETKDVENWSKIILPVLNDRFF